MSKLLELLILDELRDSFTPHDLQFGFADNRGTTQASLLVAETVQWHLSRGAPVFAANLDAHKCFDCFWHDGLFFRLLTLLSPRSWQLLLAWYRHLTARVSYSGRVSWDFTIRRGTRQGAILSPTLANVFLKPLLERLDESNCGAQLLGYHVPAGCYADDLLLLSTNARQLGHLLYTVETFAKFWRLKFVNENPIKTKSHCLVFGAELLSQLPAWHLSGQQLEVRSVTEHLGATVTADLNGTPHVERRICHARGSFYGLTPAGVFSNELCPLDKAFLWKAVVSPALTFGFDVVPLRPSDIENLEQLQSRCVKAALGLPKYAHHSALLTALGIPRVQEQMRRAVLFGLSRSLRSQHRLSQVFTRGLATLAIQPSQLLGSYLGLAYTLVNQNLGELLYVAAGSIDSAFIRCPIAPDGHIDTLRFLASRSCPLSRRLLRLLTVPPQLRSLQQ